MKSINVIIWVFGFMTVGTLSAQQPVVAKIDSATTAHDSKIEVYQKENIPYKKPIPYAPIREADVMYERTIWREIDLRQKQNYPLYFPIAPTKKIGGRVNFFTLLMEGIERGEITPYDPFSPSDEFALPIKYANILANPSIRQEDTRETTVSVYTNRDTVITIKGRNLLEDGNIERIRVKEKYIFDKRHSTLIRQVVGICPVFMFLRPGTDEPVPIPVCWIYMPEARSLLSRHAVFNDFNEAQNMSYDDFFMQNRYSGRITKMANIYNNRSISEYASGLDALYESKRIEDEIFDWEQDLWEY